MSQNMQSVEVCFSPALYDFHHNPQAIVVVVDILRASSSICTALKNGASAIIPVGSLNEAKQYKKQGYIVAAERDGLKRDFADFGNSPFYFTPEVVAGKEIVYSTTNGTNTIQMASKSYMVVVGAYLNISALTGFLLQQARNVIIVCAGWKGRFCIEDSLFAGALAQQLLNSGQFNSICDATQIACAMWKTAGKNLTTYIENTAQYKRLLKNNLHNSIAYCHTFDVTDIIPVLEANRLVGKIYCRT